MKPRPLVVALLVASALLLIAHSLVWNFVTDDAFISFVYSRNLVDAGQLVFNLGERVEGYTNFLWTLLLALFLKLGVQPELSSRVLGTAFATATLGLCARGLSRLGRDTGAWLALPALFLCSSPGYACWSSGGLETQMFTFFFTAAALRYIARSTEDAEPDAWVGLLFGLAALTRPEGVLFFALTALHRALVLVRARRLLPARGDLVAAVAFLALVAPHFVWRRTYYGWWLPNTFYIKSSGGAGTWSQGGYYLARMAESLHVWAVLPLAVAALGLGRAGLPLRRYAGYTLFVSGVFYLYIAKVGGDFMGLFRFALPVLPLLVVLACASLRALAERLSARPLAGLALA